ncbi:hypothetical protein AAZX31_20G075600 [Glycine max]
MMLASTFLALLPFFFNSFHHFVLILRIFRNLKCIGQSPTTLGSKPGRSHRPFSTSSTFESYEVT